MSIVIKNDRYAYLAYRSGKKVVQKYLGLITNPEVAHKVEEIEGERAVPEEFYYLFWDTDPRSIDLKRNARYVIERVLELGSLDAMRWVQRLYPTRLIIETLEASRKITAKSRNFWSIWFDLCPIVFEESEGLLAAITTDRTNTLVKKRKKAEGVPVAGAIDIASMKVVAISQRGAKRDFFDLYFVLQDIPFRKIAENMVKRFSKDRINPVHIGKSLVYFSDADADPEPRLSGKEKPSWEKVKKFFVKNVQQMVLDMEGAKE